MGVAVLLGLLTAGTCFGQEIPPGTLLPVQLKRDLQAGKSPAGERIAATLMQDVRWNGAVLLRNGSTVEGHVVESQAASSGTPARIGIRFDSIRLGDKEVGITTSLRALASMLSVYNAELPTNLIDDFGSTIFDWNTTQVGGQGVYRGDHIVVAGPRVVAKASSSGEVTGKPMLPPGSPCAQDGTAEREQSFWVFSTDVCGLYGFTDYSGMETVTLAHTGDKAPSGNIVLESQGKLELRGGSGLLLIVQPGQGLR